MTAIGFFDGGSRGNPGVAGSGWALYDKDENEITCGFAYVGSNDTNNTAEYDGVLNLIKACISHKIDNVKIYGDSDIVIKQIKGVYKCNKPHLQKYKDEIIDLLEKFKHYELIHVPRHENIIADALSNMAMNYIVREEGDYLFRDSRFKQAYENALSVSKKKTSQKKKNVKRKNIPTEKRKYIQFKDGPTKRVQLKRTKMEIIQDCDVYIGRKLCRGGWDLDASKYASPIPFYKTKNPQHAMKCYYGWVSKQKNILQCIFDGELDGKTLGCFCDIDSPCHGDVLVRLANNHDVVGDMLKKL